MFQLFLCCLTILVGWGFWQVCRPRPAFEIRLKNGVARRTRGKVTAAFLRDVQETGRTLGVTSGVVRGKPLGGRIVLVFSGSIPPICQQRLRNLWMITKESERRAK
jgi:hypothetical protein